MSARTSSGFRHSVPDYPNNSHIKKHLHSTLTQKSLFSIFYCNARLTEFFTWLIHDAFFSKFKIYKIINYAYIQSHYDFHVLCGKRIGGYENHFVLFDLTDTEIVISTEIVEETKCGLVQLFVGAKCSTTNCFHILLQTAIQQLYW